MFAGWGAGDGMQLGDGFGYPDSTTSGGIDFIQQSQDAINAIQAQTQTKIDNKMALLQTNASNSLQSPIDSRVAASVSPARDNAGGGILGTAAGGLSNAYNGASTDTTGSVMSGVVGGAVTGAEIGSIVPGVGTVIGAVAGGIIGGVMGFFGSKSKKKAEKQAFEQQEQLAIAPQQQAEANYLQNQGLLQKAISNYAQYYNPQGSTSQFTNKLLGNKPGTSSAFSYAPAKGEMPNFAVAPSNVATSKMTPASGVPTYASQQPLANLLTPPAQAGKPQAPPYTGDKTQDSQNLSSYQQQYAAYLAQQNQKGQVDAMGAYAGY